jgi:predicted MFS family arabinose efflux permease
MRWSWLVLLLIGVVDVFICIAGLLVGALRSSPEPILFFIFGAGFFVGAFVSSRSYKRYEVEAMATAAKELEVESDQGLS